MVRAVRFVCYHPWVESGHSGRGSGFGRKAALYVLQTFRFPRRHLNKSLVAKMTSEKITIVFDCPGCGRSMNGPADLEFQKVRCPACGNEFFPKAKGGYSIEKPARSKEISATVFKS